MSSLISLFRQQYPQGSLCCDLLEIDRGLYIVQASVAIEGVVLATALAAQSPLEAAEDMAKQRVLETLNLSAESADLSTPSAPAVVEEIPLVPVAPAKKEAKAVKQSIKKVDVPKAPPDPKPEPPAVVSALPIVTETVEPVIAIPEPAPVAPPISFPPSPDPVAPVVTPPLPLEDVSFYGQEEPGYIHGVDPESSSNDQPEKIDQLPLVLTSDSAPVSTPAKTEPEPEDSTNASEEPMDFSEVIARSNLELKRLGWTSEQGRNYLLQTYGKRSRQLLSDEQLIEFLAYLEKQPTPE